MTKIEYNVVHTFHFHGEKCSEEYEDEFEGYISDVAFESEAQLKAFLEGYYGTTVVVEKISKEEALEHLTNVEYSFIHNLNNEWNKWMEGRTALYEWVETYFKRHGYSCLYPSGRQPQIKKYIALSK